MEGRNFRSSSFISGDRRMLASVFSASRIQLPINCGGISSDAAKLVISKVNNRISVLPVVWCLIVKAPGIAMDDVRFAV